MTIKKTTWLTFALAAALGWVVWLVFTYPTLSFLSLKINRDKAADIAEHFLVREMGADLNGYSHAAVFSASENVDRYLQKALGYRNTMEFLHSQDMELFFWSVRFFKEKQKEQYRVNISASTGEVTGYSHSIDNDASSRYIDRDEALKRAVAYLKQRFGFNPDDYVIQADLSKLYKNRTDYTFSWMKKDLFLPWNPEDDSAGSATVLTGIKLNGDEVLQFNKVRLDIPEQFNRYIKQLKTTGNILSSFFRIFYLLILASAVYYVIVKRNNLVMHTSKKFCIGLTLFLFLLRLAARFNEMEVVFYNYPTTSSMSSFLWRQLLSLITSSFVVTIGILMPCLAGIALYDEMFPKKKEGSFLYYIRSSLFTRDVAWAVGLGYLGALIMIGIQSLAFELGQRYLGVWVEHTWMAQLSSSYLPFLGAFILGMQASFTEEISYRMFGISLGKKAFKNLVAAAIVSSLLWGYAHSGYLVFPMWFRGLEVTLMGLFLAFVYLRFGIIPVLVTHYLFDVFWTACAYLLGKSSPYHFYTCLLMLLLPAIFAVIAFVMNRSHVEREMTWKLSRHQIFNLGILKHFLKTTGFLNSKNPEEVKQEISSHGWDFTVVDRAVEEVQAENNNLSTG